MATQHADPLKTLSTFDSGTGKTKHFYSLPALQKKWGVNLSRLPLSMRVVLESVLRHCDGKRITEADVRDLVEWKPKAERAKEIPFVVARILLQDFTGVPLLVDLAAMRSSVERMRKDPKVIEPLVPVELVVDHSVQVDYSGVADALKRNMEIEFKRNGPRYEFLKWGTGAFNGFAVVPPGVGIVHQVNLEYLARGVMEKDGVCYPDSLVGTDSHTTMINGLGIVGWGVGGIEAEAGMLGQPVYFLTPDVVGVHLKGKIKAGVTATDLVLRVTEVLRKHKVVGKFVEFFGEGAASLAVTDRATIANMAPEYGATMGFFPVDEECCRYLAMTGRPPERVETFRRYYQAQEMFGVPKAGEVDYSETLEIDLGEVEPAAAGPKRPQDRILLKDMKTKFLDLLYKSKKDGGYEVTEKHVTVRTGPDVTVRMGDLKSGGDQVSEMPKHPNTNPHTEAEMANNRPTPDRLDRLPHNAFPAGEFSLGHGDVVIAAITSCTNTSNPSVMIAAGLVAKKAVERGLKKPKWVKSSLGPGSRVVTDYLERTGLQTYLDRIGFQTVGYGCTTCIGNSGPLEPHLEEAVRKNDIVVASVLSGNRNFEARVHQSVKANFLMSPPLVVAYALAGKVDHDMINEPLGKDGAGKPVFMKDIWPTPEEIAAAMGAASDPHSYRRIYADIASLSPMWREVEAPSGIVYKWNPSSTYVREPNYFEGFTEKPAPVEALHGARALAVFGDSITTDHISPAGAIKKNSPAGKYLVEHDTSEEDFNTYGARRGNHEVMVRGTFANVRIRNLMLKDGTEGGYTNFQPGGEKQFIYDAAMKYAESKTPLVILAGSEYGTGSSRDWAAKGTRLLGVRAVVAKSFERIHRSNLVGMGVLPFEFEDGKDAASYGLDGTETYEIPGIEKELKPLSRMKLIAKRASGEMVEIPLRLRIDTQIEVEYYKHGGILPYVLRRLVGAIA